jgi:hypothetical protein
MLCATNIFWRFFYEFFSTFKFCAYYLHHATVAL